MSLKKIIRKNIEDNAVTEPKLANEAVTAEKLGTDFITGLTELTSVADNDNLLISDTSAGALKKVSKLNTTGLTSPTFSSVSPDNSQTVDGGNITFTITGTGFTTGTNARLIGASGQRLNFDSVTRSSTTSITAVIPRSSLLQAQSPYGIQVINGEGLAVTAASQIEVDNIPIFNTSAGSLGTFTEGESIDVEVSAYDPDSTSDITFELQSGSLPAGLSLVNQSGDSCRIQGTASAVSADTTSNFTLRATDSASNTTSRSFSITIEDFALNGLRIDDDSSDYLSRTPSSTTNRRTFTISFWIKSSAAGGTIFSTGDYGAGDGFFNVRLSSSGRLVLDDYDQGGNSYNNRWVTPGTTIFRDPSAWYHMVISVDSTQATLSDRVNFYLNGENIDSLFTDNASGSPSLNADFHINYNKVHQIGRDQNNSDYFDGYISEFILVDGSQLTPTSFGETDSNGVWIPKAYSGSFGSNGFYLDFVDSADLGNDVSGNNNDFTENNITSIDKVEDTPQNNYATLNPLNVPTSNAPIFSEGNLKTVCGTTGGAYMGSSTIGVSSGKWYAEMKVKTVDSVLAGISANATEDARDNVYPGQQGNSVGILLSNGQKYINDSGSTHGASLSANDIIQIALDLDNNNVYFGKNGQWFDGSGNANQSSPSSAISITTPSSTTDGVYFFSVGDGGGSQAGDVECNFGNPPFTISSGNSDGNGYGNFEYAVPSGYYALNSKNLAQYG